MLQILRRIDADCLHFGNAGFNGITVLQPAQLLQRLRQFERGLGKRSYLFQYFHPIGIQTDVFVISVIFQPLPFFRITLVRNDGTAEIKGVHVLVEYHFRRIDVLQCLEAVIRRERFYQGGNLRGRVVEASLYGFQL